ncbi:hypothetical protein UlMin_026435 [Ulmus minor]
MLSLVLILGVFPLTYTKVFYAKATLILHILNLFVLVMSLLWWNLIEQVLFLNDCHPILSVTLLRFHGGLMTPHPPKMVASIVKRLKDLESKMLVSKLLGLWLPSQVMACFALCLVGVIDNTGDPPLSILHQMLIRTSKLLKNPHFMAKPAVIQLNTSIMQSYIESLLHAGGAPTQNVLSSAVSSIRECLKSNDWTTWKAASIALGEMASGGGSFLGPFKASYIQSLELCRFNKVKPVRDTLLQALHCWKTLPGHDTSEPSEAGSALKGQDSFVRKKYQNLVENPRRSKDDDWHIEIAVPKTHAIPLDEFNNEESEGSSVTKTVERMSTDITSMQNIGYEYVHMDDKQECSLVSILINEHFVNKFLTVSADGLGKDVLPKQIQNQKFTPKEIFSEEQIYTTKMQDCTSLGSTHLSQIENKQSNLVDLLQVKYTTNDHHFLSDYNLFHNFWNPAK